MKKIFSITVLIVISLFIGRGTQQFGLNVAVADTLPPPIDGGCGADCSGSSSDSSY